jgi:hypothetical protein
MRNQIDDHESSAVDLLFSSTFARWRLSSGADSALPGAPVVPERPGRRRRRARLARRGR